MIDHEFDSQESSGESTPRRAVLASGATVGASALAGCYSQASSASGGSAPAAGNNSTNATSGNFRSVNPERFASAFGEVVNMREAGADPTGKEDVSPVIERELSDDTLLYFPSGRYKMNSQVARRGNRDIGIIGQNAILTHGTVEAIQGFEVTEGEFSGKAQHFKIGSSDNPHNGKFVFGGFTLDWRRKNSGIQILNHSTTGRSEIRSVKQVGIHSLGCQGPMRLNPATESAEIRARNLDFRTGGLTYQKTINDRVTDSLGGDFGRSLSTSGIVGHPRMHGRLRIQKALVGGWPDNGIYCVGGNETQSGTVEVVNCVAANSHASNIRIGGDNSRIKGCMVVTDEQYGKYYFEQRPIRVDNGTCRVEDTRIVQKNPTGWSITVQHAVEKAQIENVYVEIHKTPMLALVIDDGVGYCSVKNFEIHTVGFEASRPMMVRGRGDKMVDVSINGKTVS